MARNRRLATAVASQQYSPQSPIKSESRDDPKTSSIQLQSKHSAISEPAADGVVERDSEDENHVKTGPDQSDGEPDFDDPDNYAAGHVMDISTDGKYARHHSVNRALSSQDSTRGPRPAGGYRAEWLPNDCETVGAGYDYSHSSLSDSDSSLSDAPSTIQSDDDDHFDDGGDDNDLDDNNDGDYLDDDDVGSVVGIEPDTTESKQHANHQNTTLEAPHSPNTSTRIKIKVTRTIRDTAGPIPFQESIRNYISSEFKDGNSIDWDATKRAVKEFDIRQLQSLRTLSLSISKTESVKMFMTLQFSRCRTATQWICEAWKSSIEDAQEPNQMLLNWLWSLPARKTLANHATNCASFVMMVATSSSFGPLKGPTLEELHISAFAVVEMSPNAKIGQLALHGIFEVAQKIQNQQTRGHQHVSNSSQGQMTIHWVEEKDGRHRGNTLSQLESEFWGMSPTPPPGEFAKNYRLRYLFHLLPEGVMANAALRSLEGLYGKITDWDNRPDVWPVSIDFSRTWASQQTGRRAIIELVMGVHIEQNTVQKFKDDIYKRLGRCDTALKALDRGKLENMFLEAEKEAQTHQQNAQGRPSTEPRSESRALVSSSALVSSPSPPDAADLEHIDDIPSSTPIDELAQSTTSGRAAFQPEGRKRQRAPDEADQPEKRLKTRLADMLLQQKHEVDLANEVFKSINEAVGSVLRGVGESHYSSHILQCLQSTASAFRKGPKDGASSALALIESCNKATKEWEDCCHVTSKPR
ncbi:hypothetical protein FALBO_7534 [Fusarium albosuccineum]|uniref:Uncharacterized protein n=1 Tax=Fusarium albosuccineum TaxID=1237068 RepID=A0A8H4LCS7_9HYPO|nr:hypothetical protein FALBO_7534 [Fusarium albosuccineum]